MAAISTSSGRMLIVAADQRNGMKAVMTDAPDGPGSVTVEQLADAKADLVRYLGNQAPAILLDPEVALPRVVDDATLARDTALVVGMDASGFETVDGLRYTRYVEGVTARGVRELGGDVAKMLFYMRPDRQGSDSRVGDEIRDLVKACEEEGLLLIVEVLTYRLDDESEDDYRTAFPRLVADAARVAVECGAKVLKLPYPGSAEGSALCGRRPRDVHHAGGGRRGERSTRSDGRSILVEGQPRRLGRRKEGPTDLARPSPAPRAGGRRRRRFAAGLTSSVEQP
jgi:tagatose 1,6-diphosphate aldolase